VPRARPSATPAPQPLGPRARARRQPLAHGSAVAVAGLLAGAALGWIVASVGDDSATGLRARVVELEAAQARLEATAVAARERAAAAEVEVDRLRAEAASLRSRSRASARGGRRGARADGRRRAVAIDWGGWDGLFSLTERELERAAGEASVRGRLRYTGGAPCAVGYVELAATFYARGHAVGSARWSASGLAEDEPASVTATARVLRAPRRVELLMTDARCAA
jgi:hypothetical protein